MSSRFRALLFVVGFAVAVPGLGLSAQAPLADTADLFIGTWILDVSKCRYDPGPPPKSELRTFDYTRDGMILSTSHTVNADGSQRFGHWVAKLDGSENLEFSRSTGRNPSSVVSFKRVDPYTIEITAYRGGRIAAAGSMTVSNDGKTMTRKIHRTDVGQPVQNDLAVFERQP